MIITQLCSLESKSIQLDLFTKISIYTLALKMHYPNISPIPVTKPTPHAQQKQSLNWINLYPQNTTKYKKLKFRTGITFL